MPESREAVGGTNTEAGSAERDDFDGAYGRQKEENVTMRPAVLKSRQEMETEGTERLVSLFIPSVFIVAVLVRFSPIAKCLGKN